MYLSVLPPFPFGAGSLSSYFFYLFSVPAGCYVFGDSTTVFFCSAFFRCSASFYSCCFFFFSAYYFLFCTSFSAYIFYAVNFSKLALQELTIVYSACFWLAKKSVLLLKNPNKVSKNPLMLPFCWMIVIKIPSNFSYSIILKIKCFNNL